MFFTFIIMDVKYDQHFLISKNIMLIQSNISNIKSSETILEIGAGDGRLSQFILQKSPKKLISIEIDESFKDKLLSIKNSYENFEPLFGNGLEIIEKVEFDKIIANIPYSITEPLYKKLLEKKVKFALLLHGRTFYEILMDNSSKWHYFVNSFYEIELIKDIPGNAFEPPAKTMSVLLLLKEKKNKTKFDIFLNELFLRSKRNIRNALIFSLVEVLEISKKDAKKLLEPIFMKFELENKVTMNIPNEKFVSIVQEIKKII